MKTCIVLGSNSDIYQQMKPMLAEDYKLVEWHRKNTLPGCQWDLMLVMMGTVAPVGLWWEVDEGEWEDSLHSNLIAPIRFLRRLWQYHNPGASVCFMAGSNPNMIMDGYSAYNVGKMGLLKAVEQMDHETPDAKFFALAPGIVLTKIHTPTAMAEWYNPKLEAVKASGRQTPIAKIYQCLQWCIAQPKNAVGGRNICVSDDWGDWMAEELIKDTNWLKLRRNE